MLPQTGARKPACSRMAPTMAVTVLLPLDPVIASAGAGGEPGSQFDLRDDLDAVFARRHERRRRGCDPGRRHHEIDVIPQRVRVPTQRERHARILEGVQIAALVGATPVGDRHRGAQPQQ